jgi:hypothetical protein
VAGIKGLVEVLVEGLTVDSMEEIKASTVVLIKVLMEDLIKDGMLDLTKVSTRGWTLASIKDSMEDSMEDSTKAGLLLKTANYAADLEDIMPKIVLVAVELGVWWCRILLKTAIDVMEVVHNLPKYAIFVGVAVTLDNKEWWVTKEWWAIKECSIQHLLRCSVDSVMGMDGDLLVTARDAVVEV